MPGLGTTLGRGGATMPQWDLVNADCIVIQGSDMAECHPVAFRFVVEAKERGAKIIHVDPRFSRTSALADLHVPIRPGGDVALLGGLIREVIESGRYFRDYVVAYTNAADVVAEEFRDTEDLDGLFSGYDAENRTYDPSSWGVTGERDETLEHPRCVFQVLRRHFARYTPEMVEQVAGVSPAQFRQVADALLDNSGRDRTTALCYAVGWTQHTTGVQVIRAAAILQLLLGNMGRPGGGILALRGHATIQGSTDIPTLYHLLAGYLVMPRLDPRHRDLGGYFEAENPARGWLSNGRKYMVSLLKAWFGDAATAENDFGYGFLPRVTGDHSHIPMFLRMRDGGVKGLFVMGQNPAVGGQNARLQRRALGELDWLVVRYLFETETAAFWRRSPEVEKGEIAPRDIKTEVFFLPAAASVEKDGSYTNTHRLIQWHDKAVDPPGDCRSEATFLVELGRRLKALYADSTLGRDRPIQVVTWEYPDEPAEAVLAEINGRRVADGALVDGFGDLKDDGSTACGAWIYSGIFAGGVNRARARVPDERGWGFAWPANRRTLYNRASADPDGRPWSERKRLIEWDGTAWVGGDVPDVADGYPGPFIMQADGRAQLFVSTGLKDGPLPTHYEPAESPLGNPLYGQSVSPTAPTFPRRDNRLNDQTYPYVITTYRLTEHHTAGAMTRWLPWLAELQPELFCEIGPELAEQKAVRNGDWVVISTRRGEVEARALVTERIKPLRLRGRVVHQVGLPWHWGYQGLARGDVANDLSALVADPTVSIHEAKAFTCDLRPGRRARRG